VVKKFWICSALAAGLLGMATAQAAEPAACKTVRISNIGWTDNQVQNAIFSNLLTALGYTPQVHLYSVEVTYAGLKNNQLDVFLDDWTPSNNKISAPYIKEKAIQLLGPDLTGAKYTLVVPDYLYKQGLTTFADIHKFGKQLDDKIYGIEPGNDGNSHVLAMIHDNKYGLGKFHLVQSSEAGMLSEVSRKYAKKQPIVFLGWKPHPMNIEFHIKYLTGGAKYFGPNQGAATIYINVRHGYVKDCPNVGKLLTNFKLPIKAESDMMYKIQIKKMDTDTVAKDWLKANQDRVKKTLSGVTTFSGKPGLPAVMKEVQG
jgi:glycine betaine/proline transport system substrate-binding protein